MTFKSIKQPWSILSLLFTMHTLVGTPIGEEKKLKIVEDECISFRSYNVPHRGKLRAHFFCCLDDIGSDALKEMFESPQPNCFPNCFPKSPPDVTRAQKLFESLTSQAQEKLLETAVTKRKYFALLEFLFSTYNFDSNTYIETRGGYVESLLYRAMCSNHHDAVHYLIDRSTTLDRQILDRLVEYIRRQHDEYALTFIVQNIDDPNVNLSTHTSLAHVAAEMGSGSTIDALLQNPKLLLCANNHRQMPGTIARNYGYGEIAAQLDQKLLEQSKTKESK